MRLHVNGQWKEIPEVRTVADVLHHFHLVDRMVVVELNREIIPREQYDIQAVRDGDHMEIVHFVGGG
ncbi:MULTISPECIES: sulfur carrier protein ThiS [Kyrpidia]|uniref:Sulfur carrier for synthesis of hydroxyethylthiazole phosphate n=2 Tax=Kyrpidia spormannii TaxID=2055160 RepID=A0A6F9E669_9BACL|nr:MULTISPECIES: sulfur carrier protein ThiS [Kyrpidia]MCL6575528.1 sulfur carrier protein ThiS [Kyrpidia sp.]CAB3391902.1 sulfur carrier for synthesis of hydroxyethylthiazole phosphate [Kyrpidia spormannii]CAB3392821.1 sulfur carrier for synthesis of hydroxyethylthiazole phosphate [Kyrpidia spormannii]HHY66250.1 sulfur carrier protein ThiS [Alicyclobacillus sp.]